MSTVSHQTARLSRGSHRSPEGGTCVMELASMLAGEPFSDRPQSVCPVIAGFLRSYNDGVGADDRDDLYRFASEAVGTRAGTEVTAARARLCHAWVAKTRSGLAGCCWQAFGRARGWPLLTAAPDDPAIGALAGRLAARLTRRGRPGAHASALALVDRMLEIPRGPAALPPYRVAATARRAGETRRLATAPARAGW